MPASLHPLHSLCAFPSKKHNQSPESRPRDPRDGMKIRLNDYLRSAYSRIGEAGRRLPTNRARCIERKIASRDPLSKIIPPRPDCSRECVPLLATVPSINNRTLASSFPSSPPSLSLSLLFSFFFIPVSHYSPCRPYRSRTRGFVSNAATASYYTDYRLLETEAASGTASVARFSAPTFPTVATVSIERHCFTDDYEELRSFFFTL